MNFTTFLLRRLNLMEENILGVTAFKVYVQKYQETQ